MNLVSSETLSLLEFRSREHTEVSRLGSLAGNGAGSHVDDLADRSLLLDEVADLGGQKCKVRVSSIRLMLRGSLNEPRLG
jgi:hypothetical protein